MFQTSINQLFQSDSTVSVKTQICAVVKTIVTTIHQVYSIFYEGNNTQSKCHCINTHTHTPQYYYYYNNGCFYFPWKYTKICRCPLCLCVREHAGAMHTDVVPDRTFFYIIFQSLLTCWWRYYQTWPTKATMVSS